MLFSYKPYSSISMYVTHLNLFVSSLYLDYAVKMCYIYVYIIATTANC